MYMLYAIISDLSEGATITGDNSRRQQAQYRGHSAANLGVMSIGTKQYSRNWGKDARIELVYLAK